MNKKKIKDGILNFLIWFAAILTALILIFIVGYVFISGIGSLTPTFLKNSLYLFANTILMILVSLLIVIPIGVGSAVYINEYVEKGKIVGVIKFVMQCLSAIPSIIYGLFGMLFFVRVMNLGFSILAGSLTLSVMVLPTIYTTAVEALSNVPDSFRKGSYALGASKIRTITKIILPSCSSGIISGIVLATGRIMGETAALIFTAGTVPVLAKSILQSGRTLAIHMYLLAKESTSMGEAYATAILLILLALIINTIAARLERRNK